MRFSPWVQDEDRWCVAVTIRRPDGVRVRRYVKEIRGAIVDFTRHQTEAMKITERREAEQVTCDVRLISQTWHPVRMVRLTRDLEDRAEHDVTRVGDKEQGHG